MKERISDVSMRRRLFVVGALAGIAIWKGAEAIFPLISPGDSGVIEERLANSNDEFLKGAVEQRADDVDHAIKWDGITAIGAGVAALSIYSVGCRRQKREELLLSTRPVRLSPGAEAPRPPEGSAG